MGIAIRAEHVSKEYRLGVINHGMLYKDFQSWMARKLGRDDPHAKIGEDRFQTRDDQFWALKDVSFDIQEGDRVGIIGKNGAGKSTLLRILSRITAPTEGRVKIKGRVTSLLEVGTGFHGELTGRENIYLNGAILGMKKREIDRKIDEIIDFSGIEQHIDTPVKRYSSGMYVRLAFAVAAHLDSEILLADEVLAVGDAEFQKKAIGKMNDLSSGQGRTILFVSHNINAVKSLCNNGIILKDGRIFLEDNISACISVYGGEKEIKRTKKLEVLVDETGSPFDVFHLHSYSLVDENNEILDYNIFDHTKVYISIHGTIVNMVNNMVLFITIKNLNNEIVWINDIFESRTLKYSDLHLGSVHIKMEIPILYLQSSEYSVSVSVVLHHRGWEVIPDSNALFFKLNKQIQNHPVYESDNYPMTGNKRPDILALPMPVELEYL